MKTFIIVFSIFLYNYLCEAQKNANQWDDRNTIVHLFEWKFLDIAAECENFLQHKGYGGVQVSPITENLIVANRPWWERYQPLSYTIDTRAGTEVEFKEMVERCNAVGIRIYVDVIINHMGGSGDSGLGTAGNIANPNEMYYPGVPFDKNDFHEGCTMIDFFDPWQVRNCKLLTFNDVDQSKERVRKIQLAFFNKLVNYGVAGFRVDAAKHMWPEDLYYIYSNMNNLNSNFKNGSRPFIYQEVIDFDNTGITRDEYTPLGAVTEFRYGALLTNVFTRRDKLTYLQNWGPGWGLMEHSEDALVFIDNHDSQRGHVGDGSVLTYKRDKIYKMAVAFMLAHPYGTTRIMSSYDFSNADQGPPQDTNGNIISPEMTSNGTCSNGWICEHRWRQMFNMVGFKNVVKGTEITNWWSNGHNQIAFGRGNRGFVAFTTEGDIDQHLPTSLPDGTYCDVISGGLEDGKCTGKSYIVQNSNVHIWLKNDEYDGVLAMHVKAML